MRRKTLCSSIVCVLMLAGLSVAGKAQDAPYRISDKQVQQVMKQLKKDTERFRKSLDSSLDKSRLNGTNREDDINKFMEDYEKATERLYDRFKDHKSVGTDVEAVLDGAAQIDQFMAHGSDRFMRRNSKSGRAERDWAAVRQDLRQLAEAYNVTWRWWSA